MAEIPVEIISSGYTYDLVRDAARVRVGLVELLAYPRVRVDGTAVDVKEVLGENLGALVDGSSGSIEYATEHVLGHANLQAVPGELDFGLCHSQPRCPSLGSQVGNCPAIPS